jgi:hypothetical protein
MGVSRRDIAERPVTLLGEYDRRGGLFRTMAHAFKYGTATAARGSTAVHVGATGADHTVGFTPHGRKHNDDAVGVGRCETVDLPCASGSGSTFSRARRGDRTIEAWLLSSHTRSHLGSSVIISRSTTLKTSAASVTATVVGQRNAAFTSEPSVTGEGWGLAPISWGRAQTAS